jgi:Astacin (Peptidase family M12A)
MKTIVQAMNVLSTSTCIKFQRYDGSQKDYVVITSKDTGCHSGVGRRGGAQSLNLQYPGCTSVGEGNIFSKTRCHIKESVLQKNRSKFSPHNLITHSIGTSLIQDHKKNRGSPGSPCLIRKYNFFCFAQGLKGIFRLWLFKKYWHEIF